MADAESFSPAWLCAQVEADFPGIWARLEKHGGGGAPPFPAPFPIVREAANRTLPPGTLHPTGIPFSSLLYSEGDAPEHAQALQGLKAQGVSPDTVFVSYPQETLQALAAWRTTRLSYNFDPHLYDALAATPLKGTPPAQIFERLPAPAFYLARNGGIRSEDGRTAYDGAFVAVASGRLLLIPVGKSLATTKLELALGSETVEQALDKLCAEFLASALRVVRAHPKFTDQEKQRAIEIQHQRWPAEERHLRATWGGILSALMYLCIDEPDVSGKTPPPVKIMRMGAKVRYIVPKQDTTILVGERIGSVFAKAAAQRVGTDAPGSSGRAMPAHVRRAHWHTYWTGTRGQQTPLLKWLSPILVNAQDTDGLVAVAHPVPGT